MTVSTTQGSPACRNTYPATGGSSKIAISGRMFSHAKPALNAREITACAETGPRAIAGEAENHSRLST